MMRKLREKTGAEIGRERRGRWERGGRLVGRLVGAISLIGKTPANAADKVRWPH